MLTIPSVEHLLLMTDPASMYYTVMVFRVLVCRASCRISVINSMYLILAYFVPLNSSAIPGHQASTAPLSNKGLDPPQQYVNYSFITLKKSPTSTLQLPFKTPKKGSTRDHKAVERCTLGGLREGCYFTYLWSPGRIPLCSLSCGSL